MRALVGAIFLLLGLGAINPAQALVGAALPALADVDGNGFDEQGVYFPAKGEWRFIGTNGGQRILWGGGANTKPIRGDFDGDGGNDLALLRESDFTWSARNRAGATLFEQFHWGFAGAQLPCVDYTGDGITDLAAYDATAGRWYVSTVSSQIVLWGEAWGFKGTQAVPGDYDGDGTADLAIFYPATGRWFIRTLAGAVIAWDRAWGFKGTTAVPGDFDGDQIDDLALFHAATGDWYILSLSKGVIAWKKNWGWSSAQVSSMDFDRDGRADLMAYDALNRHWYFRTAGAVDAAQNGRFGWFEPGDFDHDGRADLSVFDPKEGEWYGASAGGQVMLWKLNWGSASTVTRPADFDGDGRSEIVVFEPATGSWYVRTMTGKTLDYGSNWGFQTAKSFTGDVNGDGRADYIIFDPASATWYVRTMETNVLMWAYRAGGAGEIPVPGDYNGDGRIDLATYNASTFIWTIDYTGDQPSASFSWGYADCYPVPADYDGDGQTDPAVTDRDRNLHIAGSRIGTQSRVIEKYGDLLVPGDFDRDGIDELGQYRDGNWRIGRSSAGWLTRTFGFPGARPAPAYFTAPFGPDILPIIYGGGGGFVWKPVSESNNRLVVLLPSDYAKGSAKVLYAVISRDARGTDVLETEIWEGANFNGRPALRFSKAGSGYGKNIYLVAFLANNSVQPWYIPDGAVRVD